MSNMMTGTKARAVSAAAGPQPTNAEARSAFGFPSAAQPRTEIAPRVAAPLDPTRQRRTLAGGSYGGQALG